MRRMSFSATVPQMRAGTKTVTRRTPDTWTTLRPGDRLLAIEKGMGLKPGERQIPIRVIEIASNRVEPLHLIGQPGEAQAEGFHNSDAFREEWCRMHGQWNGDSMVRRIEFRQIYERVDRRADG